MPSVLQLLKLAMPMPQLSGAGFSAAVPPKPSDYDKVLEPAEGTLKQFRRQAGSPLTHSFAGSGVDYWKRWSDTARSLSDSQHPLATPAPSTAREVARHASPPPIPYIYDAESGWRAPLIKALGYDKEPAAPINHARMVSDFQTWQGAQRVPGARVDSNTDARQDHTSYGNQLLSLHPGYSAPLAVATHEYQHLLNAPGEEVQDPWASFGEDVAKGVPRSDALREAIFTGETPSVMAETAAGLRGLSEEDAGKLSFGAPLHAQANGATMRQQATKYMYGKDPITDQQVAAPRSMPELLSTPEGKQWFAHLARPAMPAPPAAPMVKQQSVLQLLKLSGFKEDLAAARETTNTSPSDEQIAAENYAKGVVKVRGLTIAIENPKGATRSGTDKSGKKWSQTMAWDYGYAKNVDAVDGDKLDIFLGPDPEHGDIYVVDQVLDGKYDESKIMLGFSSEESAREGYLDNYEKGWQGLGAITKMTDKQFHAWCAGGQTHPADKTLAKQATGTPTFLRSLGVGILGSVPGAGLGALSAAGLGKLTGNKDPEKQELLRTILAAAGGALGGELDGQFDPHRWDMHGNKLERKPTHPGDRALRVVEIGTGIPMPKTAADDTVEQLRAAKEHSDKKRYTAKHSILRKLFADKPEEFYVDAPDPKFPGVTHAPSGFKFHAPSHLAVMAQGAASEPKPPRLTTHPR